MDISKHISTLLLYHECVIIPDFGGFITNYVPSGYNAAEQTFTAPTKEIVFNNKIKNNDGVLIYHLVKNEQLSYAEAMMSVHHFSNYCYQTLYQGEKIEFENVGSLRLNNKGNIIFHQNDASFLTNFGLNDVSFPTLAQYQESTVLRIQPRSTKLNRSNALKIAASIGLLVTLSLFPLKNKEGGLNYSSLNPIAEIINADTKIETTHQKTEATSIISEEKTTNKPFIIVGGSFQHYENARTLFQQFEKQGEQPELFKMDNGLYRVIVNAFDSKSSAINAMKKYRDNHPGSNVWVSTR